ncbi:hypothetical protein [Haloterrigena salinisoli]|uniref:hypothetical protein n=1 Tax=Haloterrigena salinisoli TaxID=3132747 RepID=UPI0030D5063D
MSFYMVIPQEITFGPIVAIIPVLVLAFVLGQALHSLAAGLEKLIAKSCLVTSHRTLFAEKILNPDNAEKRIIEEFKVECSRLLHDPSLLIESEENTSHSSEEWKELYPTIQSYIYNSEVGRSRTFQAIYAFSRSMSVLFVGLPLFYITYYLFQKNGFFFDRQSKYLLYFPNFGEFIEVAWPLCWLGALLFLYSTYTYRKFFVQYLISDFVALRTVDH